MLIEAQRLLNLAEQSKLQAEIKLYELQMTAQDILLSVMTGERDLASRDVTNLTTLIKIWQDQVQKIRQQEAQPEFKIPIKTSARKNLLYFSMLFIWHTDCFVGVHPILQILNRCEISFSSLI